MVVVPQEKYKGTSSECMGLFGSVLVVFLHSITGEASTHFGNVCERTSYH
jgi:hypothetical protein